MSRRSCARGVRPAVPRPAGGLDPGDRVARDDDAAGDHSRRIHDATAQVWGRCSVMMARSFASRAAPMLWRPDLTWSGARDGQPAAATAESSKMATMV